MPSKIYSSIKQIADVFRHHGVSLVFLKELAEKQDNDKNQIYLGGTVIPAVYTKQNKSRSAKKRHSEEGKPIIYGSISFSWIDRDDNLQSAPNTKLIDYFQYPEIRLSGFIKGANWAPEAIRRTKQQKFGKRILLFGIRQDQSVVALLITELEDPIVSNWPSLPKFPESSFLKTIVVRTTEKRIPGTLSTDSKQPDVRIQEQNFLSPNLARDYVEDVSCYQKPPKELLIEEFKTIIKSGWHLGSRLKPSGEFVPFYKNQAGGYTLEALLGVPSNAKKVADKLGYEIKSFPLKNGRISLMTPTADLGAEGELSFFEFMKAYGWQGKTDSYANKFVFNGLHKIGKICPSTRGTLVINSYDTKKNEVLDVNKFSIEILRDDGKSLAAWSLSKMASSWSEKHSATAYVPYISRYEEQNGEKVKLIKYGPDVYFGEGTSVMRLIDGIARGIVYYDPGHDISLTGGAANVRPQWRINGTTLTDAMAVLYRKVERIDLT